MFKALTFIVLVLYLPSFIVANHFNSWFNTSMNPWLTFFISVGVLFIISFILIDKFSSPITSQETVKE